MTSTTPSPNCKIKRLAKLPTGILKLLLTIWHWPSKISRQKEGLIQREQHCVLLVVLEDSTMPSCGCIGYEINFSSSYAGVLSAYGMGLADIRSICEAVVETKLSAATTSEEDGSNSTVKESFGICEKQKTKYSPKVFLRPTFL